MRWHLFCKRAGGNIKCNFTGYLGASCADKRLSMATLLSGVEFFTFFGGEGGCSGRRMETWERGWATIRGSYYALYSFAAAAHAFELLMEQETMMVENNKQTDRHAFVSAASVGSILQKHFFFSPAVWSNACVPRQLALSLVFCPNHCLWLTKVFIRIYPPHIWKKLPSKGKFFFFPSHPASPHIKHANAEKNNNHETRRQIKWRKEKDLEPVTVQFESVFAVNLKHFIDLIRLFERKLK